MTTPDGHDRPDQPDRPSWLDKPTTPPGGAPEQPAAEPTYESYSQPAPTPYPQPGQSPYTQSPYTQPAYGQPPYGQAPYGQQPYGQMTYGQQYGYAPSRGTNGLAIASLVCSLIWVCGVGSIAAVIMGHISRGQIRRSGEQGDGLAIAGLIIGYLGVVALLAYIALVGIGLALDPNAFD